MKKNDKLIVIFGVVILVIASLGIYYWGEEVQVEVVEEIDFFNVTGVMIESLPDAVLVSDNCPFNALAATPLAVSYDELGRQRVVPLYIENEDEPSTTVERAYNEQITQRKVIRFDNYDDPKELSLDIAEKYWKESKAALLIDYNRTGYYLGVSAVPLASYLRIPVIVTDSIDSEVTGVLNDLGVEKTLVCGNLTGFGKSLKFESSDEIVDMMIDFLPEKFKKSDIDYEINYITIANPRDAFKPAVIEDPDYEPYYAEGKIDSGNLFPSGIIKIITSGSKSHKFTIPDGYKYALVKLELISHEDPENIENFGDSIQLTGKLTGYCRTIASPANRDSNGNIINDRFYFETVFYDMGGEEFTVSLTSIFHTEDSADYEIIVTVENLENPYYPFMPQMSSMAPYLSAHYKGIVFANPDFAFVLKEGMTLNAKELIGDTQVMYNPQLIPLINQHVYEKIHLPINNLLAKIRDINIETDVEDLTEDCREYPFYIALIGDTTMVPQYYYRSPHSDPYENPVSGAYGTNVPSDYIYGNIDPQIYSMLPYAANHVEDDLYSEYPEVENIVGRINGWDVQDASALIARTIFYNDVLKSQDEDWKENALVMTGAGTEVQRLPFWTFIQGLLGQTDPMKFPSGEKFFLVQRIAENFADNGLFNVFTAERGQAQREGYTWSDLWKIKTDGLLNFLFFPMLAVKIREGGENFKSVLSPKWWAEMLLTEDSGIHGEELQENSNLIISDSHAIWFEIEHGDILMDALGGPKVIYELLARYIHIPGLSFRTPLDSKGSYSVRDVSNMKMGPSVMMIEGCGSGKIDGLLPTNFLANAYLHAGVNAYISPTTTSAFYGALEPRFGNKGVGFGIVGFLTAWLNLKLKHQYPPVYFNQFIFEEATKDMFANDVTIGEALRNAKNDFLPAQLDIPFRWTPPLSIPYSVPEEVRDTYLDYEMKTIASGWNNYPVEKYATIYQIN
jgi:hypothetical protein